MLTGEQGQEELIKLLNRELPNIIYDRKTANSIENYFVDKGFNRARIAGLMTTTINPLTSATLVELCLLTIQAYNYSKNEKLNPKDHFTSSEIEFALKYKELKTNTDVISKSNVVEFKEMKQVNPWQFAGVISLQEINECFKRGLITYNINTQRETKKEIFDNQMYESPNFNYDKITSIKNTIKNIQPITNIITLNIRKITGEEKFNYNPKAETLSIEVDKDTTHLDIIDSSHRGMGIIKLMAEDPNVEYNFIINIYHYDENEARQFIATQDLQTPLNKLHVETMKRDNPYMTMAQEIAKFGGSIENNEMFGKIGTELIEVEAGNAYTTYDILTKAIEYNFGKSDLTARDRMRIKSFLIEGFNYIIGTFKDEFDNKIKSRKISMITHQNTFVGYVAMLSKLYGESNWMDGLDKALENIVFSKDNRDWKEIKLTDKTLGKSVLKRISEHFYNYIG